MLSKVKDTYLSNIPCIVMIRNNPEVAATLLQKTPARHSQVFIMKAKASSSHETNFNSALTLLNRNGITEVLFTISVFKISCTSYFKNYHEEGVRQKISLVYFLLPFFSKAGLNPISFHVT